MDKSKLHVLELGRWSGGGGSLLRNIHLAKNIYPKKFSNYGVPVVLRNVVSPGKLLSGDYIYMPQNAWAWHGPVLSFDEWRRRTFLRISSEMAYLRMKKLVRIGPLIPDHDSSSESILANVLDEGFEQSYKETEKISSVNWLPSEKYFLVPGSMWGYRNLDVVIEAYREYRKLGGESSLVLVGVMHKGSGAATTLKNAKNQEGLYIVNKNVGRSELLYAMKRAEACVLASVVEASPVTLIEAGALGIPIIAWRHDGYQFLAKENRLENVMFVTSGSELCGAFQKQLDRVEHEISDARVRKKKREEWAGRFVGLSV